MTKKQGIIKPAVRNFVVIPLYIEHLISSICGSRYGHGLVGGKRIKDWREICRKLVKYLERYIDANLDTDKLHRSWIDNQIAQLKKALTSKVGLEREPRLVGALLEICLLLLGDTPNHYWKKVMNRPEYFRLQGVRSAHYHQSPIQKVVLVLRQADHGALEGVKREEAWQLRAKVRQLKSREFLNWFQTEYPKDYQKLF
jgi:hypothetical protein